MLFRSPSRGLISTVGLVPACKSLDCLSVMAGCIEDVDRVFDVLAGRDDGDYVARIRTPWIEVAAPAPIPVNLDGEPVDAARFRFACEIGCIRMVLPERCPCLAPRR